MNQRGPCRPGRPVLRTGGLHRHIRCALQNGPPIWLLRTRLRGHRCLQPDLESRYGAKRGRNDGRSRPAAGSRGSQIHSGFADRYLDFVRLEAKGFGYGFCQNSSDTGTNILRGHLHCQTPAFDRQCDPATRLPPVEPICCRDADTAPVTTGFRGAAISLLPELQRGRPSV